MFANALDRDLAAYEVLPSYEDVCDLDGTAHHALLTALEFFHEPHNGLPAFVRRHLKQHVRSFDPYDLSIGTDVLHHVPTVFGKQAITETTQVEDRLGQGPECLPFVRLKNLRTRPARTRAGIDRIARRVFSTRAGAARDPSKAERSRKAGIGMENKGATARWRRNEGKPAWGADAKKGLLMKELQSTSARTLASVASLAPIGPEKDSAMMIERSASPGALFKDFHRAFVVWVIDNNRFDTRRSNAGEGLEKVAGSIEAGQQERSCRCHQLDSGNTSNKLVIDEKECSGCAVFPGLTESRTDRPASVAA